MSDASTLWMKVPLRSLLTKLVNGGTPSTSVSAYWNGTIPWVTGADFTRYGIGEIRRHVSELGVRSSSTSVVEPGNLLVVTRTGVGKLAIAKEPTAISQDITGVYPDPIKVDTKFLYFLLSLELESLKKLNQGTSINGIIRSDFERHEVSVPSSVKVQRKMAAILDVIDQAIEKTEALIEKYQQIKAGLMHDLFTRGVTADGKLRPPREQAPELYQHTPIGWIPKEWKFKPITYFADVIDPNPSHRNPIYHDEGFPFISTVEFEDFDQIRLDTSRRVIEEIVLEQERRCKFSDYSIAFSRKGTIGEIRMLPTHLRFALLDSLCVINPININSSFLFYSLRSHFLKRQIKNMTMGQALPQVSIGRVRDLLVPAPKSSGEQENIALKLDAVYCHIYTNGKELEKLKSQKSGLMQALLTGKVRVKLEAQTLEMTGG